MKVWGLSESGPAVKMGWVELEERRRSARMREKSSSMANGLIR